MVNLGLLREARSVYGTGRPARGEEPGKTVSPFEGALREGLERVNQAQIRAERAMQAFAAGDVEDISEVAAAVSEADLALRFAVQVRDRLLDSYNQLVRMSS
jgi:flagellar hook-basal body complex protein FliE